MKVSLALLSVVLSVVLAAEGEGSLMACECDAPSCNPGLDPKSLCACLNSAARFCWYRNNKKCAKPLLQDCQNPGMAMTATATTTSAAYTAPYQGNGGLNCVEIGYCSRPTRSRTSMVVTVSGVESTIVIPVGLPTPADVGAGVDPNEGVPGISPPAPAAVTTPEVPVVFTPIPGADGALKKREQVAQEKKRNLNRWMG